MFTAKYHDDPEQYQNRAWSVSGQYNGPAVVAQYFLSKATRPMLCEGGIYNHEGGEGWASTWLWPRNYLLRQKKANPLAVRNAFMQNREGWEWKEEDDNRLQEDGTVEQETSGGEGEEQVASAMSTRKRSSASKASSSKAAKGSRRSIRQKHNAALNADATTEAMLIGNETMPTATREETMPNADSMTRRFTDDETNEGLNDPTQLMPSSDGPSLSIQSPESTPPGPPMEPPGNEESLVQAIVNAAACGFVI
jgi:hypothetical protein